MEILAVFYIVAAIYLALCGHDNLRRFFRKPPLVDSRRGAWPLVSVCIPARNEEKRVGPCLKGFQRQNYPRYEVLILDDQSTDGTWRVLCRAAHRDKRFHILKGRPLPKGWVGKPWACDQLARKAKGRWLLFTDADTQHDPETLKRSVLAAESTSADLLTYMTAQTTLTWIEFLVIPTLCFDLISFFPQRWVLKKGSLFSRFVWANGQFLFFNRDSYRALGGHRAVRDRTDEDLTFGKMVVRRGMRLSLHNGSDLVKCRMYTSATDVWRGLSKIIYPSFDFRLGRALAGHALVFLLSVLPFALPFLTKPGSPLFCASLALAGVQVLLRAHQSLRFGFPFLSCFFHPIGNALLVAIGLNSMRWYRMKGGGHWRGRFMALGAPTMKTP